MSVGPIKPGGEYPDAKAQPDARHHITDALGALGLLDGFNEQLRLGEAQADAETRMRASMVAAQGQIIAQLAVAEALICLERRVGEIGEILETGVIGVSAQVSS